MPHRNQATLTILAGLMGLTLLMGVAFNLTQTTLTHSSPILSNILSGFVQQSGLEAGDQGFQIQVQGNTGLTGGVIESTQGATDSGKNQLSTGTLTTGTIHNQARYSGQSVSIGGGYSVGPGDGAVGSNQAGQATAGPGQIPGTTLPSNDGVSASPPVALSASGNASSRTQSGISGGAFSITDGRQQQALTGQSVAQTLAGVNTNVATGQNGANAIAPIFDARNVKEGFAITGAFTQQAGALLNNKARQATLAQTAYDQARANPATSPAQLAQLQQTAQDAQAWAPGGTYSQVFTALTAAAGGNVTGGTTQLIQSAAIDYLQGLGAQQVKSLADGLMDNGRATPASELTRGALQALVGCAGAVASGAGCGAGAEGAAASVVLNNVLDAALGSADSLNAAQRQARLNIVGSLVAGIAGQTGASASAATTAAMTETNNNRLLQRSEWQTIQMLAQGDPIKASRLTAAACALTSCANGVPTSDPDYAALSALQALGGSPAYATERSLLQGQRGSIGRSTGTLFTYDPVDSAFDWLSQSKTGTRVAGAAQAAAGVVGIAGSAGLCTSGIGCALGEVTGSVSTDYAWAGAKQAVTGNAAQAYGEQVLQSLGLSPQTAAYTYASLGLAPAVVDAALAGVVGNGVSLSGRAAAVSSAGEVAVGAKNIGEVTSSPSQFASNLQGTPRYPGVDIYVDISLPKGSLVVGAAPGQTPFYTTLSGFESTGGTAEGYYQGLQMEPNFSNPAYPPYRNGVTVYQVSSESTQAASGTASANPQFGSGGRPQLVIPGYQTELAQEICTSC